MYWLTKIILLDNIVCPALRWLRCAGPLCLLAPGTLWKLPGALNPSDAQTGLGLPAVLESYHQVSAQQSPSQAAACLRALGPAAGQPVSLQRQAASHETARWRTRTFTACTCCLAAAHRQTPWLQWQPHLQLRQLHALVALHPQPWHGLSCTWQASPCTRAQDAKRFYNMHMDLAEVIAHLQDRSVRYSDQVRCVQHGPAQAALS